MAEQSEALFLDCTSHGRQVATVVCRHLLAQDGEKSGFIENSSDPHDLQAWCEACELKFAEEDGMTEDFKAFTDMKIVCTECYAEAKSRHSKPRH